MSDILIFGGTFDPVHDGHIQIAMNVQNYCHFERFIFLPCKMPLLKNNSQASPQQRLEMLDIALCHYSGYHFETDSREIFRESPSYMVTTLEDYRLEAGNDISITLLLGKDSFAELPRWHKWENLLKLCNILVVDRPEDTCFTSAIRTLLEKHETGDVANLKNNPHGMIYRLNAGTFHYSSTSIRHMFHENKTQNLPLPSSVQNYIIKYNLYTK